MFQCVILSYLLLLTYCIYFYGKFTNLENQFVPKTQNETLKKYDILQRIVGMLTDYNYVIFGKVNNNYVNI